MPQRLDFSRMRHELEHAPEEYVLFGSSVMYLHGLRDTIGDVDFFASPWLYGVLKHVGWREETPTVGDPPLLEGDLGVGVPLHAFHSWAPADWGVCRDACFRYAETVQGLRCAPLWLIAAHKRCSLHIIHGRGIELVGSRWEKHLRDLKRIEAALLGRRVHQEIGTLSDGFPGGFPSDSLVEMYYRASEAA